MIGENPNPFYARIYIFNIGTNAQMHKIPKNEPNSLKSLTEPVWHKIPPIFDFVQVKKTPAQNRHKIPAQNTYLPYYQFLDVIMVPQTGGKPAIRGCFGRI